MEHSSAPVMAALDCEGIEVENRPGGTFSGHMAPGAFLVLWALWWASQSFASYHRGKQDGSGYMSRAWWRGGKRDGSGYRRAWWRGFWAPVEPLLKVLGPPVGVLVELRLDHDRFLCASTFTSHHHVTATGRCFALHTPPHIW